MISERQIVLDILLDMGRKGHLSDKVIKYHLDNAGSAGKQERAFITRLAEGVIERRITLDFVISKYSRTPVNKLKAVIRESLRMGIYQMLYMDSVPDRAAIYESVELAKRNGQAGLKGYVNGVLRNISRDKDSIISAIDSDPAVKYSLPEWLWDFLNETYGPEKAGRIAKAAFIDRGVTLRVRLDKISRDEIIRRIEEYDKDIEISCGSISDAAVTIKGCDIISLPGYDEGLIFVQDESSQAAVNAAVKVLSGTLPDGWEGESTLIRVIDLCAAPGGKSIAAGDMLCRMVNDMNVCPGASAGAVPAENDSRNHKAKMPDLEVISCDISDKKVSLIRENAERMKMGFIQPIVSDATHFRDAFAGSADLVIADVPCSGLGIIGKKNDIKYRVTPGDFAPLTDMSGKILENAAHYVKPGGVLLFSTCTINPSENEMMRDAFLKKHKEFTEAESRLFLQGIDKCDGFFYSVMKKDKDNDI